MVLKQLREFPGRLSRGLLQLELDGRLVWSLLVVDGIGLALWLYGINGILFHRALDSDDWSTLLCVPLLCYAVCLGYRVRPDRPWWQGLAGAALGQVLAAAVLQYVFPRLAMDLSVHQVVKFFASETPLLLLGRLFYLWSRRTMPQAPLECLRVALAGGVGFLCFGVRFLSSAGVGSGDSYWYCVMLADFARQWRAGIFPVFVGQSEFAFNGAVSPLRFAPALQHLAGVVDLLTGRDLPYHALQNLTLAVCGWAGIYAAYYCAAAVAPRARWTALALGALYLACPGVLGLGYQGDLFMSMTALPVIPVAAYGLWRTLREECAASIGWTVLPLAAAWYCHPPIAFWLMLFAVLAHLSIAARRWREPGLYAWWGRGALLFALAASALFVSVITLRLPSTASDVDVILESIRGAFPAMLLPVSPSANQLGDFQLGWAWLALLLAAALTAIFRPRRQEGWLLLGCAGLIFLLVPVPVANEAAWRHLPGTVRDITYHWPMQRFYAILAGFAVVLAAATLDRIVRRGWRAWLAALALLAGLGWSAREATKFVLAGGVLGGTPAGIPASDPMMAPCNLILTRYAFNPFPFVPPYFSHGYVDPCVENQIWSSDWRRTLVSNVAAARPPDDAAQIPLAASFDGQQVASLTPFGIAPGVRYSVRFVPSSVPASGALIASGPIVQREYFLPDSAMGTIHRAKARAFGFVPGSRDFFSLWTSGAKPEVVQMRYVYDQPPGSVPPQFATVFLRTYTPETLPIKVRSWLPYQAAADSPEAGAWLETPRLYIPGYAATVNGRPVAVTASPDGLVSVPLEAGANDVVVRYTGPWLLRATYWIALATWAVVLLSLGRRFRFPRAG